MQTHLKFTHCLRLNLSKFMLYMLPQVLETFQENVKNLSSGVNVLDENCENKR